MNAKVASVNYGPCNANVDAGASMVRGLQNRRGCEKAACGEHGYCIVHARMRGIAGLPEVKVKKSYVILAEQNGVEAQLYFEASSDRGVRMALARYNKDCGHSYKFVSIVR